MPIQPTACRKAMYEWVSPECVFFGSMINFFDYLVGKKNELPAAAIEDVLKKNDGIAKQDGSITAEDAYYDGYDR